MHKNFEIDFLESQSHILLLQLVKQLKELKLNSEPINAVQIESYIRRI